MSSTGANESTSVSDYDHGPGACRLLYWHVSSSNSGITLPDGCTNAWVKKDHIGWHGLALGASSRAHRFDTVDEWTPWDTYLDRTHAPLYKWFAGANTNAAFQNVDKHLLEGRGAEVNICTSFVMPGQVVAVLISTYLSNS